MGGGAQRERGGAARDQLRLCGRCCQPLPRARGRGRLDGARQGGADERAQGAAIAACSVHHHSAADTTHQCTDRRALALAHPCTNRSSVAFSDGCALARSNPDASAGVCEGEELRLVHSPAARLRLVRL